MSYFFPERCMHVQLLGVNDENAIIKRIIRETYRSISCSNQECNVCRIFCANTNNYRERIPNDSYGP